MNYTHALLTCKVGWELKEVAEKIWNGLIFTSSVQNPPVVFDTSYLLRIIW